MLKLNILPLLALSTLVACSGIVESTDPTNRPTQGTAADTDPPAQGTAATTETSSGKALLSVSESDVLRAGWSVLGRAIKCGEVLEPLFEVDIAKREASSYSRTTQCDDTPSSAKTVEKLDTVVALDGAQLRALLATARSIEIETTPLRLYDGRSAWISIRHTNGVSERYNDGVNGYTPYAKGHDALISQLSALFANGK